MLKMPKKHFFEGKNKYLIRIAEAFEQQAGLDALNAHYAATFWHSARHLQPELVIAAFKKMIAQGGDVTNPNDVKDEIHQLVKKH